MKIQPTITYIKNGIEKNIRITGLNKNFIKKGILKIYGSQLFIDEEIALIHFKNIIFETNVIKCKNLKQICIFENCTFKQSTRNTFELENGSFEFINPNFIDIHQINAKYLKDFILTLLDKNISEQTELSLDISATNINLQGNFFLETSTLNGNNIVLGNDNYETNITLLDYGWYQSMIKASKELNIKNCLIENISQKTLTIDSPILNIDETSAIKTNGDVLINENFYISNTTKPNIITKKDIIRTSLIAELKNYSEVLKTKIETLTNKHLKNELKTLNEQIEIQENYLKELKEKQNNIELNKSKAITKSLSKKSISYLEKNK